MQKIRLRDPHFHERTMRREPSLYASECIDEFHSTGGGSRTHTALLPGDFKSPLSTIPSPRPKLIFSTNDLEAQTEIASVHSGFAIRRVSTSPLGRTAIIARPRPLRYKSLEISSRCWRAFSPASISNLMYGSRARRVVFLSSLRNRS